MRRPFTRGILGVGSAAVLLYLYLPLMAVAVASVNADRFGARWGGFTPHWYAALGRNADALRAGGNSLLVATASTVIATVLGSLLGYGLARFAFPGRHLAAGVLRLPVLLPDIVLAVALLLFFGQTRRWLGVGQPGLLLIILGHVTFQLPFVALVVRARATGLDPALEEAARDLGATPLAAFRAVTLPLLAPGILAGALLAFTLSLDDFVTAFLLSGPGTATLPVLIYAGVRRGLSPEIHALSTLVMGASLLAVLATQWIRTAQDGTAGNRKDAQA
ncbi:MAG: ABC transporter permease [Verrucomicrobia bacterium]|nr:ABC transporter permease [Verrucomicrobiota bacterium]